MVHRLTRQQARRIAVRAQLLDAPRPRDLLEVVRRLWVVQVDLTAAVAPSADLVLWSRLGPAYRPDDLDALLVDRAVVEHDGLLHAADDLALFRADMRTGRGAPRCASGRRTPSTGSTPTRPAAATSSSGCAPRARCRLASCPTPVSCRGAPAGGTRARTC